MPLVQATDVPYGPTTLGGLPQASGPPDAFQRIPTDPSQFGALQGQALERTGGQLEHASNIFAEHAIEQQKQYNATVVEEQNTSYMKKANNLLFGDPDKPGDLGFYGKKGKEAMDAMPQIRADLNKLEQDHLANLTNTPQRLAFQHETRYQRNYIDRNIGTHYDTEMNKWQDQSAAALANTSADSAGMNYTNDDLFKNALLDADGRALREAHGDSDIAKSLSGKYRDQVYVKRTLGFTGHNDWTGAEKFLTENGQYITDPHILDTLQTHVRTHADAAEIDGFVNGLLGQPSKGAPSGGGFRAPPGPAIAGANPAEQQTLNEIRHRENRGDYTYTGRADDNGGGAYQFKPQTWAEATKKAGIGTEYDSASNAPPAVQDAVALSHYRDKGITPWAASGPYPVAGSGAPGGPQVEDFQSRQARIVADAAAKGITLKPGQASRTHEEQQRLYDADVASHGGTPSGMVAKPGTSQHEVGLANDFHDAQGRKIAAGSAEDRFLQANLADYGLTRPVKGEPWHIEPIGGRVASATQPVRNPQTGVVEQQPRPSLEAGGGSTPPTSVPSGAGGDQEATPTTAPAPTGSPAASLGRNVETDLAAIRARWADDPVKQAKAIAQYHQQSSVLYSEQAHVQTQRDRAILAEDERTKNDFLKRMFPAEGKPASASPVDVANAPLMTNETGPIPGGLRAETKQSLISFGERAGKPDPMAPIDRANTGRLFSGITSDDPRTKITTFEPIDQALTNGLITKGSYDWLTKQLTDRRNLAGTNDEETRKNFYAAARAKLIHEYPGYTDPDGLEKYANWARYADSYISEQRAKGQSMADILDISEKAPLGIMLRQIQGDEAQQTGQGLKDKPPATGGGGLWNWLFGGAPATGAAGAPSPEVRQHYDGNGNRILP